MTISRAFASFSTAVTKAVGKPVTFCLAVASIVIWAACGPAARYSDTWELAVNTGTTIITFLMVFLIQQSQNRDGVAIQAKLDELIRSSAALDRYIGIETLTDEELDELRTSSRPRISDTNNSSAMVEMAPVEALDAASEPVATAA